MNRRCFLASLILLSCKKEDIKPMSAKRVFFNIISSGGGGPYGYIPVIINFGQSNSLGFEERTRYLGLTSYTDKPTGVKRFIQSTFGASGGGWMDYFSGIQMGAMPILGELVRASLGTDVFVIEAGRGGASLASVGGTNNDWNELNTTDCFENLTVRMITEGFAKIPNPNSLPIKVISMNWHQGETDSATAGSYNNYEANFTSMITALRAYHSSLSDAPLIISTLNWSPGTGQTAINTAFSNYVSNPSNNAYLIDPYQVAYPWKQNLPSGVRSTYPPLAYADDNHASYLTHESKALLTFSQMGLGTYSETTYAYDKHLVDLLYYCDNNSVTTPSANNITQINTLLTTLKASTVFKKLIAIYLPANDSSKAFGQLNILAPTSPTNHIFNGGTWVSKQGVIGSYFYMFAPGQIFNTGGSTPNGNWPNDLTMGCLVHSFTSKVNFGIRRAGTANDFYFAGNTGGSSMRAFGSVEATTAIGASNRFFAISRQFSSYPDVSPSWDYYMDDVKTTVTDSRTGTSTDNAQFMRDGANLDDSRNAISFIGYGITESEMTVLRNALTTYKSNL